MSLNDFIIRKPILETENLILRTLKIEDVEDLKEWMGDLSLYEYWGKKPSKAELNPELLFAKEERQTKSFHFGIVYKEDNKVIGELWIYLIENNRMAKVAFRLSKAYHNKGLMTEALKEVINFIFTKTEIIRLWTDVHVDNVSSYKVLEKVGFLREGLIREGKMVNTYCDYYLYGLLKKDFLK